ncbi:MAG: bifunctional riboflavin kinase/FAD synthetase [Xanthomonadaceae bacterium]|nr:bifunctional riboflavin kinase/FAD synthetase [Xanthomonadaceae bacterium]
MVKVFRDVAGPCLAPGGSVVAVGAFDGLHRGHRALLGRVRERAAERRLLPIAVSFEPLPRQFFARGEPLPRLASLREKLAGFAEAGIERVLLLRFDAKLAAMPAETFVREVLAARLGAREIWVGEDFRFGHKRGGDLGLLRRMGGELGFAAHALAPVLADGERVSASRIRALLAAGEFAHAARLLGHPFAIGGRVVRGERLGRKLGYPTANVRLGRRVAPVGGIFAVRVRGAGEAGWPGVASLGVRPTVDGREPLLEAHLFDFDDDLYGRRIEVEFVAKLRDEEKFPDLDALKRQMDRDAAEARRLLGVAHAAAGART